MPWGGGIIDLASNTFAVEICLSMLAALLDSVPVLDGGHE